MLQKSQEKIGKKTSHAPKPKETKMPLWRYILPFWKGILWVGRKLVFFFLLFVGLFVRRMTYLFQALGLQFSLAYWTSVFLAAILPLSLLVIAVSFLVQHFRKKQTVFQKVHQGKAKKKN